MANGMSSDWIDRLRDSVDIVDVVDLRAIAIGLAAPSIMKKRRRLRSIPGRKCFTASAVIRAAMCSIS